MTDILCLDSFSSAAGTVSTLWPLSDLTVTRALTSSLTEVNVNLFFEAYLKRNLHLNIRHANVILKSSSCFHVNFKWPVLHGYECNNKSNKLLFVLHFSKASAVQGAIKGKYNSKKYQFSKKLQGKFKH